MKASRIHPDDTVELNVRGDHFEARVLGRTDWDPKRFSVEPLAPGRGIYSATPAQIIRRVHRPRKAA